MVKCVAALMIVLLSSAYGWAGPASPGRNQVLPQNDWIVITDRYVEELTAEEFFGEHLTDSQRGKMVRLLKVKIAFRQPCKATRKLDLLGASPELASAGEKVFIEVYRALEEARASENTEAAEGLLDRIMAIPGYGPLRDDLLLYKFQCDPRVRVRVAYSGPDGRALKTVSTIPRALYINYLQETLKRTMDAGETMWMSFIVPETAVSWDISVPR